MLELWRYRILVTQKLRDELAEPVLQSSLMADEYSEVPLLEPLELVVPDGLAEPFLLIESSEAGLLLEAPDLAL